MEGLHSRTNHPRAAWRVPARWEGAEPLARKLKISPLLAQCLYNRGLGQPQAARSFLKPLLKDMHAPEELSGAEEAAERLERAIRENRRIVIYGDYDVDGITGTAILWHVLKIAQADVDFHIPHRIDEGYGLNADALRSIAAAGGGLVITVDCGITGGPEAEVARELGLELIVTDHHQLPDDLPRAMLVHPLLGDPYPNPHLCGAGVAFKVAWALARRISRSERVSDDYRQFLVEALSLVALGTIADVVPLVGENRILARKGLGSLGQSQLPGLAALIESAGLSPEKIDSYDVGFSLAPRLNAAGRMGHARLVVEMLTRAEPQRAREIAIYLGEQNRQRQTLEKRIFQEARQMAVERKMDGDGVRAVVLAGEGWHAGVIGIVASRIVEAFAKPTVLIAVGHDGGQGSARSIEAFNMHDGLKASAQYLSRFGGHAMAGGLQIELDQIDGFSEAFCAHANRVLAPTDLVHRIELDAELRLADLSVSMVQALDEFGPFGRGNSRPRFATGRLELAGEPRRVGKGQDHLSFSVSENGTMMRAIAFRKGDLLEPLLDARRCRLACEPFINEFRGRRSVELRVKDIRLPDEPD